MDEQTKAAFASASESCKQLIGLATGLLGLEITFSKEVIQHLNTTAKIFISLSWAFFLISVIAGVWTLLSLTGCLGSSTCVTQNHIFGTNVKVPAMLQIILFLIGLILTVIFGISRVV